MASTFGERAPRGEFNAARLLWVWSVFVLIFFSLSDSKLVTYILPAVPALALLCAVRQDAADRADLTAGVLLTAASCAALLAYMGGMWSSPESRELLPLIRPMLYGVCALWAAGALICAVCVWRRRPLAALAGLCVPWFLAAAVLLVAADAAQSMYSGKDLALTLRREAAVDAAPIYAAQTYQQSWPFYLQRPVILVGYRDEFDFGLTQDPRRGIATLQQFADVWLPLSRGFAIMRPNTRDRLLATGLPMREIARFPERVIVSRR